MTKMIKTHLVSKKDVFLSNAVYTMLCMIIKTLFYNGAKKYLASSP